MLAPSYTTTNCQSSTGIKNESYLQIWTTTKKNNLNKKIISIKRTILFQHILLNKIQLFCALSA